MNQKEVTLSQVIKIIDEWLHSDDTFITDGEGGKILPNACLDCKKGSLLKRMTSIIPTPQSEGVDRELAGKIWDAAIKWDTNISYPDKETFINSLFK